MNETRKLKLSRDDALKHFAVFASVFMDEGYFEPKLHASLCVFLQEEKDLKVVVLPRDYLKSTLCSILYPLWCGTKDPNYERILISSNTQANASRFLAKIRGIVENNPLYNSWFPECVPQFSKVRWSDQQACLARTRAHDIATFESAGVGTQLTGRHYTKIIEDDTVAPDFDEMTREMAMPSPNDIEHAIGFHKLTIPLLESQIRGQRVIVGTRWTFHDLIAYSCAEEEPAIFDKACVVRDEQNIPIEVDGKQVPTHPKRFPLHIIEKLKKNFGQYYFSALYMNTPRESDFMTFKESWFEYYDVYPKEGRTVITIDPSGLTNKTESCKDAIVVCRHNEGAMHILQYKLGQMLPSELINQALDLALTYNVDIIRVEAITYQKSLIYGFEEEMKRRNVYYNVVPVRNYRTSKMERIRGLQPLFERHQVFLKHGMRELIQHLLEFPFGATLDLLDALSYQLEEFKHGDYTETKSEKKGWLTYQQVLDDIRKGQSGRYCIPKRLSRELVFN